MASAAAEEAVRTYLTALKDPSSLRNDDAIEGLRRELESTDDGVQRLMLQQRLLEARSPTVEQYEEGFVEHAKAWAEEHGVSAEAFQSEGVPTTVLRRAGFRVRGGRGRATRRAGARRARVSADDVRTSIPRGTFTIKDLQERSGASPAVVRKVINEELAAGRVSESGPAKNHSGPGRAPMLYKN